MKRAISKEHSRPSEKDALSGAHRAFTLGTAPPLRGASMLPPRPAAAELRRIGSSAALMKRLFLFASFVLAFAAGVAAQDQGQPATPAEQYQALLKEFQST